MMSTSDVPGRAAGEPPLFEVMGEAALVQDILEGRKDALAEFASGSLRIRGDLNYFSELAVELGILKSPL